MYARRYNTFVDKAAPLIRNTVLVNRFNIENMRNPADLTWANQKQIFDSVYAEISLPLVAAEGQCDFAAAESVELKDVFHHRGEGLYSNNHSRRKKCKMSLSRF